MQTIALFLFALICGIASTTDSQPGFFLPRTEVKLGNGSVPYDGNFSINTFAGQWNAVLLKGIIPSKIQASCLSVQVTKSHTNTLTITFSYLANDPSNYTTEYVALTETYQPNPLNKAQLLEVSSLGQKSLAVSYYNDAAGEALLISTDLSFAIGLAKADKFTVDYEIAVSPAFYQAYGNYNYTKYDNHRCPLPFPVAKNFNPSVFEGFFYVNVDYSAGVDYDICMTVNVELKKNSLTLHLSTQTVFGIWVNTTETYVQSASSDEIFWMTNVINTDRLSVMYYDEVNDLYVLMEEEPGYEVYTGMIISKTQTLDSAVISQVKSVLKANGLSVDSNTFHILGNCKSNSIFDIIS